MRRKRAVDSQTKELEVLEARLKQTEERLKERQSRNSSPAGRLNGRNSPYRRHPTTGTFNGDEKNYPQSSALSPLSSQVSARSIEAQSPPDARSQDRPPSYESPRQASTGYRKPVGQGLQ